MHGANKYIKSPSLFGSGHTDHTRLYSRLALRKQDYMFVATSCTVGRTHARTHTRARNCVLQKEQGALRLLVLRCTRAAGEVWLHVFVWQHNMIISWPWQPFVENATVRYWLYWRDTAGSDRYTVQRSSWRADSCSASQGIFRAYCTPRFVIPGSQETGSCPFPEPDELNPFHAVHSVSLCSSFLRLGLPGGSFIQKRALLTSSRSGMLNDVSFK
jgi:hypothetical protein